MQKELVLEPTSRAKNVVKAAKVAMVESVKEEKTKEIMEMQKEQEKTSAIEKKGTIEKNKKEKSVTEKKALANKTTEKKASTKKTTAEDTKKQVTESVKAEKKEITKNAENTNAKIEVFVQYHNQEIMTDAVLDKVKKAYVSEGNKLSKNDDIRLYIKPEENMVYYVINNSYASGISLY